MSSTGALGEETDPIEAAYRAGQATWPALALPETRFRGHVARLGLSTEATPLAEDLYLAAACTDGDPAALAAVEALAAPMVARLARRWRHATVDPADLAQALRERLFVGDGASPPRIAQYAGQGPLAHWIRLVAARLMVDLARRQRTAGPPAEEDALMYLLDVGDSPELAYLKQEYRAAFKAAFARALRRLDVAQQTILRLRFVDGLQLDEIARLEGVHRVTVSRILARSRDLLAEALDGELADSLGGEDPAAALALVRSRLSLSFERLLAASEPTAGRDEPRAAIARPGPAG